MKTVKILFFALSYFLISCSAQENEISLNLESGKKYKQVTNSKASIEQKINGQEMNIQMDLDGTVSYFVKSVTTRGYEMDVRYESLTMTIYFPQGEMKFSSEDKDESNPMSSILAEMKNSSFQVLINKRGVIEEVLNVDSFFDSVFNKFSDLPEAQIQQMKAQLMNAYGEKAFKGNLEMVSAIYPDKKVKVGDSWEIDTKLETGMSASMKTTYTLVENGSDFYLISGNSKIETEDKEAYIQSNGMPTKFNLSGSMASEIKINKKTGWIIKGDIDQTIQGDVFINASQGASEDIKTHMIMKNKMTYLDK